MNFSLARFLPKCCSRQKTNTALVAPSTQDWTNDPFYTSLGVNIDTNKEGILGESYVSTLFSLGNMYVEFLGDKAPDADCLISFNAGSKMYEFLLQVKETDRQGQEPLIS